MADRTDLKSIQLLNDLKQDPQLLWALAQQMRTLPLASPWQTYAHNKHGYVRMDMQNEHQVAYVYPSAEPHKPEEWEYEDLDLFFKALQTYRMETGQWKPWTWRIWDKPSGYRISGYADTVEEAKNRADAHLVEDGWVLVPNE